MHHSHRPGSLLLAHSPVNKQNRSPICVSSRPTRLIAARYTQLPFPMIGPMQEIAFDLGITAIRETITLSGMVVEGYHEHQLLFEQRWPARSSASG
ncbi:MAG: hypothetical protein R3E79_23495 [Caldilineaceae bacterium]